MTSKIQKWGNSLAIRIPASMVEDARLEQGSEVDISLKQGTIILKPRTRYRLEELVAAITPENRHDEIDYGQAIGKEVW
jgi:antitoxin MazE